MIPLEDYFEDMIGKAQRGLGIADEDIARQAGVTLEELNAVKNGEFIEEVVRKVAPVLKLGADQLVASGKKSWYPELPETFDGFLSFNTPFEDMHVNAYLAWDPATKEAVVFDSGADCQGILDAIKENGLKVKYILLTHCHTDHVIDLPKLREVTGAPVHVNAKESSDEDFPDNVEVFDEGKEFQVGSLFIRTLLTSGHAAGGTSFVISGLAQPVAIIGDAIFAGSMGGGMISYEDAMNNNVEKLLPLPGNTILASGHGPLTTVEQEKMHNPFFT